MRIAWLALALTACNCGTPELRVSGDTGYVRCFQMEPVARTLRVGSLELEVRGRHLRIEGAPSEWTLMALRGDGSRLEPERLGRAQPTLIVVLGGIGDDTQTARANLDVLSRRAPVLFVAGGRDRASVLAEAFGGREGALDVTPLRSIAVGGLELVPVGGAPGGRYARDAEACGVDDAEAFALEPPAGRRLLLSWAAPPPAPGLLGVEAGSQLIARIAEQAHASGAVLAWPDGRSSAEPLRAFAGREPVVLRIREGVPSLEGAP